jgi:CysZ protein
VLADAFAKALRNLLLPGILKLFLLCLLAYAVGWTVLAWLIGSLIASLAGAGGAEGLFLHLLGTMGGGVLAWFLFPLLYPVIMSFFDDYIAEAIERQDYPHLPKAEPPFWPTFAHDLKFTLKAIGLNILCLPLYLMPVINIVVYYTLNGYLLGSQFFRMAAGRRAHYKESEQLRRRHRGTVILAGVLISICATIPFLNLAAPILGVATLLHLFHIASGNNKQQILP